MASRQAFVCTMVYNRHDMLRGLLVSLRASTRQPDGVYIIDHSYDTLKVETAVSGALPDVPIHIITLEDSGCGHAANWLIKNVPDDRIGCGDDFEFAPDAIQRMCDTEGDFIVPDVAVNACACALIRNSLFDKIGLFDEKISPGYLYYEDVDLLRRMKLAGAWLTTAKGAIVTHVNGGSQSHRSLSKEEMREHHKKFIRAKLNYEHKWGGGIGQETLIVPRTL